jgi:hypothetical protein
VLIKGRGLRSAAAQPDYEPAAGCVTGRPNGGRIEPPLARATSLATDPREEEREQYENNSKLQERSRSTKSTRREDAEASKYDPRAAQEGLEKAAGLMIGARRVRRVDENERGGPESAGGCGKRTSGRLPL